MKHGLVVLAGALLLAWILSGCIADDKDDDGDDIGSRIGFAVLRSGQTSGIGVERLTVIREGEAFAALWQEHGVDLSSPLAQPEVDFSQDMVVAVFLGERSTGGYSLAITEVRERSASFMVKLKATLPADDCVVSQAASQPYQMATISRSSKVVAFTTEAEVGCP
ncbi:MAG: protease complex subunit PrcB family protein [Desulfurivibrio sp.]